MKGAGIDEGSFRVQVNVRLDRQGMQELRAVQARTGEDQSALLRRLVHEECERLAAREEAREIPTAQPGG